ncbi:MAG: hypothetical protein AAB739_03060 [Patescibacteria group bacterium]
MKNKLSTLRQNYIRQKFIKELKNAEKDWEKHGGLTLTQIEKKYCL